MTATLSAQGHIILPPEAQRAAQAHPARSFDVMVSTSGVIMLLPERQPSRSLVESFAALRGLKVVHRRDPIPPPPVL